MTDAPVEIRPGQRLDEIVVTFGDRPTKLTGSVIDAGGTAASGFPVVVFSTNRNDWRWESRRVRQLRLADDGTFSFVGLPPGEYWLAVLNEVEPNQWFDPQFLDSVVPGAVKVTLLPGQTTTQRLRMRSESF